MKKQISIFSCSALVLAIVASCSSNVPVVNSLEKVDSVKVSQINKVQTNENGSVKVNLRLTTNQPKFGIKALTNGWTAQGGISKVVLKLHDSAASGSPQARFDGATLPVATKTINSVTFAGGIFNAPASSFNNLKAGQTYRVSARAYSNNYNLNAGNIDTAASTIAGSGKLVGTGTSWNTGGRNKIMVGDFISFNDGAARNVKITNVVSDTQLDFVDSTSGTAFIVTSGSNVAYTSEVNVTGAGSLGGSMAADGLQNRGGTAGGLGTITPDEEFLSVNGSGVPTITNDGQFNASTPNRAAGANNVFDISVQITKEIGAQSDGAVRVYQGGYDAETITP